MKQLHWPTIYAVTGMLVMAVCYFTFSATPGEQELAALREQIKLQEAQYAEKIRVLNAELQKLRGQQTVVHLSRGVEGSTPKSAANNSEAQWPQNRPTPQPANAPTIGQGLSPEMKEMLRTQQAKAVKPLYGDLLQKMGLNSDEKTLVLDILAERRINKDARSMGESDEKLRSILGEQKFAQIQEYASTLPERMVLKRTEEEFTSSGIPLTPDQSQTLFQIMIEERGKAPRPPTDLDSKITDQTIVEEEDFQRRTLGRIQATLSPDQILVFQETQKEQLDTLKFRKGMQERLVIPNSGIGK